MIIGVIFFTFVVSNINSIISQKNKKHIYQEKNLLCLNKANKEYEFSESIMNLAQNSLKKNNGRPLLEKVEDLLIVFPKNLKKQLQLCIYKTKLSKIKFFMGLHSDILIALGQSLYTVIYTKSNSFKVKIVEYTQRGILLINYILLEEEV